MRWFQSDHAVIRSYRPVSCGSPEQVARHIWPDERSDLRVEQLQPDDHVFDDVPNASCELFNLLSLWIQSFLFPLVKAIKYSKYIEVHQCVMAYLLVVYQVGVLCVVGQLISSKLQTIADEIYQTNWYKFPSKIQRMSILLINQSQQSFVYKGNSIIVCLLPTLLEVTWFHCLLPWLNQRSFRKRIYYFRTYNSRRRRTSCFATSMHESEQILVVFLSLNYTKIDQIKTANYAIGKLKWDTLENCRPPLIHSHKSLKYNTFLSPLTQSTVCAENYKFHLTQYRI